MGLVEKLLAELKKLGLVKKDIKPLKDSFVMTGSTSTCEFPKEYSISECLLYMENKVSSIHYARIIGVKASIMPDYIFFQIIHEVTPEKK